MSKKQRTKTLHVLALVLTSYFAAAAPLPAFAQEPHGFDIAAGDPSIAVREFGKQSGVQIIVPADLLAGKKLNPIAGQHSIEQALQILLADTGITHRYIGERGVVLVKDAGIDKNAAKAARTLHLAKGDTQPQSMQQVSEAIKPEASSEDKGTVQEIIVTAQKRQERLIDVPQAVTVLSANDLAKVGATQFRDYASKIPGLGFNTTGAGHTAINLRGLAATQFEIGSRVSQYVDEVPYGASNPFTFGGRFTLDPALFDIDRIEILRGPQGTLYGASSMGGLIKYVTARPDAGRFGVDLRTGIAGTDNGGMSYNGSVTVNAPIAENKAALRVTGFEARDGGYIDNLARADNDTNQSDIYGGRADLLLTPNEQLSIRLSGFFQNIARDGEATADYTFAGGSPNGELGQRRAYPESFDQHLRLASGTIEYQADWATLTSISSYQSVDSIYAQDYQYLIAQGQGAFGALGSVTTSDGNKIVQEARLTSKEGRPVEWTVGGFYTREDFTGEQVLLSLDLAGKPLANNLYKYVLPSLYKEYAAFGTLTWYLTDTFDVSGGLRYAHNSQEKQVIGTGSLGARLNDPLRKSSDDVLTYLANARYHFSDQATAYLRYATGYKAGGPNAIVRDPATGAELSPDALQSETLKSYEVGLKAQTFDRRFGIDAAIFYTDWKDIQVNASRGSPAIGVYLNTPSASVKGSELTLTALPARGLTLAGAVAYTEAQLAEAAPDFRGVKGERLPNVPRLTAALSADYEWPAGGLRPTVGISARRVSDRLASYNANTTNRQYRLPPYEAFDLRAGLTLGTVDLQLYVRNLLNERGQLSAYTFQGFPQVAILQPRTVGLSASTRF